MDFKEWSSQNKCELSLDKNDVLQVDIDREGGEIALVISGKTAANLTWEITLSLLHSQ